MLIIHDNGKIVATMSGEYENPAAIVANVPDGYHVESVDMETGEPVIVPDAATDGDRMKALEKQMMQEAGNHSGIYEDPIPFVYGMATVKGRYYSFGGDVYVWNAADCASCVWLPTQGIWEWKKAVPGGNSEGTEEDPIPAERGMEYEYGKCYLDPETDGIYRCARAGEENGGKITLSYLPHELIGQYFEVV